MGIRGEMEDGAGKRVMKCEMCTEINRGERLGIPFERQSQ
jgi:hypothetical protein